jgi:hypothetical protein
MTHRTSHPNERSQGTWQANPPEKGDPALPNPPGTLPPREAPGELPDPDRPRREGGPLPFHEDPVDPDAPRPDLPRIVPSVPGPGGTDVPTSPHPPNFRLGIKGRCMEF